MQHDIGKVTSHWNDQINVVGEGTIFSSKMYWNESEK